MKRLRVAKAAQITEQHLALRAMTNSYDIDCIGLNWNAVAGYQGPIYRFRQQPCSEENYEEIWQRPARYPY